jgi:hypothetical protein
MFDKFIYSNNLFYQKPLPFNAFALAAQLIFGTFVAFLNILLSEGKFTF